MFKLKLAFSKIKSLTLMFFKEKRSLIEIKIFNLLIFEISDSFLRILESTITKLGLGKRLYFIFTARVE